MGAAEKEAASRKEISVAAAAAHQRYVMTSSAAISVPSGQTQVSLGGRELVSTLNGPPGPTIWWAHLSRCSDMAVASQHATHRKAVVERHSLNALQAR